MCSLVYKCLIIVIFVFNCRHDRSIKHFQISQVSQNSGVAYVLDRQFHTLQDLVKFYSERDVPNVEAIAGVRLTFPLVCSSVETSNLHDSILRQLRSRRVSADDAASASSQDAREPGRCSDVIRAFRQSISESHSDDVLSSEHITRCRKFLKTLKQSVRKNRSDPEDRTVQLVASPVSDEVDSCNHQSGSSFCENPKKYCKQPAIPDDNGGPALPSMTENSAQSSASFTGGADALAAAAANYNAAATDATAAADARLYYSKPRDVDRELSNDFMARLLLQDEHDHVADGKCVCGLYLVDSELPRGWSMHISTECGTEGRLFFTSPAGETSWELPTIVSVDLDTAQQDRIRQLMIEGPRVARQQMSVNNQFSDGEKPISV